MVSRLKEQATTVTTNGEQQGRKVLIVAPNMKVALFHCIGNAPLVIQKFSTKAREMMKAKQEAGDQSNKGQKRGKKDFQACYEACFHRSRQGWLGISANAFRTAMIDACRIVGFKMTHAKCVLFVEADGFDVEDGTPLVKIAKGKPHPFESTPRNDNGNPDVRIRPMWDEWEVFVRVRYDADLFSLEDVANLMQRAGISIGVGEGRPFSKNSAGCGWGTWDLAKGAHE